MASFSQAAGSREADRRLLEREIARTSTPPLIRDLPQWASSTLDSVESLMDELASTSTVSERQFNKITAIMKVLLWMEVPLQRPSILTNCCT